MPWRPSGRHSQNLRYRRFLTACGRPPSGDFSRAFDWKTSDISHIKFAGVDRPFAGRSGRSKASKFPASAMCSTWFPRYHTLRPRELLLDEKKPQSSEEYAKSMVWYRTTFILHYEPTPHPSLHPYTNHCNSARRSRRRKQSMASCCPGLAGRRLAVIGAVDQSVCRLDLLLAF